jgi:ferrous iron transport protein B
MKGGQSFLKRIDRSQVDFGFQPERDFCKNWQKSDQNQIRTRFAEVDRILSKAILNKSSPSVWTERVDRVLLHPVFGSAFLILLLAFIFQAIFSWAEAPKEWIESGIRDLGNLISDWMGRALWKVYWWME